MAQDPDATQGRLFDERAAEPSPKPSRQGRRRLRTADRTQIAWDPRCIDEVLPDDHPVRNVALYVERLDVGGLLAEIQAVEGSAGAPAADPRILLELWLYGFLKGIGSARELDRLCREHLAWQWLCGGLTTNYHTLSDFRVKHQAFLDELLTHSAAVLIHRGLATLERVAQDGMRVRASAGAASFRREGTLQAALAEAQEQLTALKAEAPAAGTRRQQAARERAARERAERLEAALGDLPSIAARKKKTKRKPSESDEEYDQRSAPRASSTDPEARTMKMPDGGYRPGYNINFVTDCASRAILGVMVTNVGSDHGLLAPMVEQVEARYGQLPKAWLADGGFNKHADLELLERSGIEAYLPPQQQQGHDRYQPQPGESEERAAWRARMGTAEGQTIYQERASTAEFANAQARNRGLQQLPVRGSPKVTTLATWYAVAHNLARAIALGVLW